ncbi:MAG: DUF4139 domain-containing protein [Acetobacteraceae bacterium]|nr:DUF4139 domain-containing protein [Acetobacteraceae bacterium]
MRAVWLIAAVMLASPALAQSGEPSLRRVMLSSGGVAYVEYAAEVAGDATLRLAVPLAQVDDVLKSLVVFDSRGGVGGATLPGLDGTQAAFGDVPFGPEALGDPLAYLNALRGVAMEVRGPRPMQGVLLRAERVPELALRDGAVERTRVSLLTDEGLRQFVLEDVEAVQVADPVLRARIAAALAALKRDAAQSTRLFTLRAPGTGSRTVRVGYVVGAPLWKVSYRLVLPGQDGDKARLQGWAVLENTTGADWKDVAVALQYGNPVTFRQALYRSYFVQRPEVPVEVLGRILPGVDTRAFADAAKAAPPPPPMAPASRAMGGLALAERAQAPAPVMAAPAETAAATEGAQETVFELPSPVTLMAGHSATMPILDRAATARRIGLVQQGRRHPLAAIRLTNDTPTSLPAGVLTLYDPTSPAMFAGDARLGGLPSGESRLLSFAEDLRTDIAWRQEEATSLAAVSASQGVLRIDERLRWTTQATLTAPAGEARDLLVEIAKRAQSTLVPDPALAPAEETATAWRFAVTLKPGENRTLVVRQDRIQRQSVALMTGEQAVLRLMGMQGLDPAARAALQRLVDLRAALSAKSAEVTRLQAQGEEVERDQARTRSNLGAVPSGDALHTRLLRQLEAQETRIEALRRSQEQARAAVQQAQRELEAAVAKFSL